MVDSALFTNPGGRSNNEDYVASAKKDDAMCFVLCDGLGGHDCGEVASETVAEYVIDLFKEKGNYKYIFERVKTQQSQKEDRIRNKGQATKGAGRMPWHWEPKKDVVSCDKLRGVANRH